MARSRTVRFGAVILAGTLASACSSGGEGPGPGGGPTVRTGSAEPTSAVPVFDPPHAFNPVPIPLGSALRDFIYHDDTQVVTVAPTDSAGRGAVITYDAATGRKVATSRPPGVPDEPERVFLTRLDGEVALFTAVRHTVPGQGTQVDTHFLRIRRFATDTGREVWTNDLPMTQIESAATTDFVAVTEDHVVVSARDRETPGAEISRGSTGLVLDTRTGATRWLKPRFIPYAAAGDIVVGTVPKPDRTEQPNLIQAFRAGTGAHAWTWSGEDIDRGDPFGSPVGPDLVQINTHNGRLFGNGIASSHLVQIATGRTLTKVDIRTDTRSAKADCRHDGERLVVCAADFPRAITGIDAGTGRHLWRLDENTPGRRVPELIDARRGVVYVSGKTTLDGRTGEDLDVALGVEPVHVGKGYALARERSALNLHRATR
jgi:outer membrane protein assembly factor BamB